MENIALICCRLNSKGVFRKNLRNFCGKPILYWLNLEIKKSNIFHKVYLSSDSREICNIGRKLGMIIPGLRPKNLAKSSSDVFDVHKHIFKKIKINDKNSRICTINNNPFLKAEHFKKTFQLYKKYKSKKIIMIAKEVDKENSFFRQSVEKRKVLFPIFQKKLVNSKINRQNQESTYVNSGDLRWGKKDYLSSYKKFNIEICKNGYGFIKVIKNDFVDINTRDDWNLAIKKFKELNDTDI